MFLFGLKRCPIQNEIYPISLNFRSIDENHLESSTFEIVKLKSASTILISCWVQVCWHKSKCLTHSCHEKLAAAALSSSRKKNIPNPRAMPADSVANSDYYTFKEASIRLNIEDPYGVQPFGENVRSKSEIIAPNVIGI